MLSTFCASQESQAALPAEHFPHDALRLGLRTLKDENAVVHPLEATQKNVRLLAPPILAWHN